MKKRSLHLYGPDAELLDNAIEKLKQQLNGIDLTYIAVVRHGLELILKGEKDESRTN